MASYSIQGVQLANPTPHWTRKHAAFQTEFEQRRADVPEVFDPGQAAAAVGPARQRW